VMLCVQCVCACVCAGVSCVSVCVRVCTYVHKELLFDEHLCATVMFVIFVRGVPVRVCVGTRVRVCIAKCGIYKGAGRVSPMDTFWWHT